MHADLEYNLQLPNFAWLYTVERVKIKRPHIRKVKKVMGWFGISCLLLFCGFFYGFAYVFDLHTPKSLYLESENRKLASRLELLNQQAAGQDLSLTEIQRRDNVVYRPIFGMDEISPEVRSAGIGGEGRYDRYEGFEHSDVMADAARNMDILSKKVYIQSRSFDDVEMLAKRAGDMASCVPSLNPVAPKPRNSISSSFGYRVHPVKRMMIFHSGIDFRGEKGEPIYAAGSGVVESVMRSYYGYGSLVVINHGFGYKTRYAHLSAILVQEGQAVTKGEEIAKMGRSGQSTGVHLHYEVIYKGRHLNPYNFINMDMSLDEYRSVVKPSKKG